MHMCLWNVCILCFVLKLWSLNPCSPTRKWVQSLICKHLWPVDCHFILCRIRILNQINKNNQESIFLAGYRLFKSFFNAYALKFKLWYPMWILSSIAWKIYWFNSHPSNKSCPLRSDLQFKRLWRLLFDCFSVL